VNLNFFSFGDNQNKKKDEAKQRKYLFFLVMMSRSLKRKKWSVRLHFLRSPDAGLHNWVSGPFFTRQRDFDTKGTFCTITIQAPSMLTVTVQTPVAFNTQIYTLFIRKTIDKDVNKDIYRT